MTQAKEQDEQEPKNVTALLVGLARFAPDYKRGDTVVFGPRLPKANQEARGGAD